MSYDTFGIVACSILALGIMAYGVLMTVAAKAIHDSQRSYYQYLKKYSHHNLADYYTKEDLEKL